MTSSNSMTAREEWRRGWPIVLAAGAGFGTGVGLIIQTYGFFIKPMREELGWSLQALSLVPVMHICLALFSPAGGWLIDQWGARRAFLTGLLIIGTCLVGFAMVSPTPLFLYGLAIAIGIVGPLTSTIPTVRGVVSWFRVNPGTAIGLAMNGTSVMSLAAIPIVTACIYYYGWRAGFLALAGLILFVGMPIIFFFFRERKDSVPAGADPVAIPGAMVKDAVRSVRFWLVLLACTLGGIAIGGFIIHLQPLLGFKGFGLKEGAFLGMVYAVSIIIGRAGGGFLLDRLSSETVALTLFVLAGAGALTLGLIGTADPWAVVIIAVLLVGMGQGAEGDFVAFFTFRNFGMRRYSTLVGIMNLFVGFGFAFGGFIFAVIFDELGSYLLATQIAAACFGTAGILIFSTRFAPQTRDQWTPTG